MRIKIATTACMVTGMIMVLAWPFLLSTKPDRSASKDALRQYAVRNMAYFGFLLVLFFVTIVLAWLVLRQTRREFAEKSRENLQNLIQGTLEDHGKKNG